MRCPPGTAGQPGVGRTLPCPPGVCQGKSPASWLSFDLIPCTTWGCSSQKVYPDQLQKNRFDDFTHKYIYMFQHFIIHMCKHFDSNDNTSVLFTNIFKPLNILDPFMFGVTYVWQFRWTGTERDSGPLHGVSRFPLGMGQHHGLEGWRNVEGYLEALCLWRPTEYSVKPLRYILQDCFQNPIPVS